MLAIATYLPAGLLRCAWVFFEANDAMVWLALLAAGLATATVYCKAMNYASLRTIPSWSQALTTPNYLMLVLASGAFLFNVVLSLFQELPAWSVLIAAAAVTGALLLKRAYWQAIDNKKPIGTVEAATGLGRFAKLRLLEPAHTQPNFVMRKMGYAVGRKHAERLRQLAIGLGFLLPAFCLLIVLFCRGNATILLMSVGTLAMAAGLVIERWLFFAEADHAVMLYYGYDAVYQAAEIVTLGTLSMRNGGRDGRRLYHLACVPHALARAAAPSATPDERVSEPSTARPLRFSISAWPNRTRQAFDQSWLDRPLPLRSSLASSSVVEAWGSFERVSPPANPSAEIPFAIPAGTRWLARSVLGPKAPHRRSRGSHAADASKAPGPPDRHR